MATLQQTLIVAALALAGASAPAQTTDFTPLMAVAKDTWPSQNHIGVVANYRASKSDVDALALAAGAGMTITVVDLTSDSRFLFAVQRLRMQVRPDYLVLLPKDPMVRDGSTQATRLIGLMAERGCPTIATTSRALAQGALFALGAGTGMELMISPHPIGTVKVVLPGKAAVAAPGSQAWFQPARVTVLASR